MLFRSHCLIKYAEKETADRERQRNSDGSYTMKSTNYTFLGRFVDPLIMNAITLGNDTLVTFNIKYENALHNNYQRMWNGSDSATITTLPADWNNKDEEKNVIVSGTIEGNSFTMKTVKDRRIKEFYITDQLVAVIQGDKPVNGFLFRPVSLKQLKLFTILASLPYTIFNVHENKW